MTHFSLIKFAQAKTRRRKTLADVMPVGSEWSYFVVLSDAYLSTQGGETHIKSFDDLRRAMNIGDSLQALQAARTSGRLTEGRHELPDVVASCLAQSCANSSSVRTWRIGASESETTTIASSALSGAWVGSGIEEMEVVDQAAHWYFRMKDDEPLILLAVRVQPLLDQIRRCSAYCVEVGSNFEYAR